MSRKCGIFVVSSAQVVTATGAQSAALVPAEGYDECLVFVTAAAMGGTTPSFTPTLQSSPDGVTWYDHTAGSAMTANGSQVIKATNIGPNVRVNYTVSGTTPTAQLTTTIACKKLAN